MAAKRNVLGKGLDSLIPNKSNAKTASENKLLAIKKKVQKNRQVRHFLK